jgi:hypothetical protein
MDKKGGVSRHRALDFGLGEVGRKKIRTGGVSVQLWQEKEDKDNPKKYLFLVSVA